MLINIAILDKQDHSSLKVPALDNPKEDPHQRIIANIKINSTDHSQHNKRIIDNLNRPIQTTDVDELVGVVVAVFVQHVYPHVDDREVVIWVLACHETQPQL